ncbi:hypothetical protein RINTHH_21920 [Richelia intracellularis HH01]|uniref:Uncharacterized protein n=1 Tax=Richelia intracellularis HH01 TaxID=1165094 RepID=M1X0L0_9NOST|nr:hypothetical protein [Richelia intracellularis]CCH68347.1 hypothetical protein RINTHH_21920 [Richelia intracellularis HH01]
MFRLFLGGLVARFEVWLEYSPGRHSQLGDVIVIVSVTSYISRLA